MPDPSRFYRWLLKLYPAGFRDEYESPMERQFRDEYRDAEGHSGRARLWLHTIRDVLTSAPGIAARELVQDLRYSARVYRGRAVSAAFAVAALGLAIGACTAVFSVLNALLLRGLPFSDPARLVELRRSPVGALKGRAVFTEWPAHSPYLQGAATFSVSEMNLAGARDAVRVKVAETSANFFQLLGTNPAMGRTFALSEDAPGQTAVAVISYSLWQQWFGGAPDAAGASLRLNGTAVTVIGVAPPRFDYPGKTDIWLPSVFDVERIPKRGVMFYETVGRLKPGVELAGARRLFETEASLMEPDRPPANFVAVRPELVPLRDQLAGSVREASWILAGLVLLVLLTACANVAQLLLSRTSERRQELAVRAALGASRARLLQQLITESTALTAAGAAAGLLVAHWAVRVCAAVAPAQLATQEYTVLDLRVIAFAAALALATGIVSGVLPAWLAGRMMTLDRMLRNKAHSPEKGTRRMRAGLAALQAGLTLILVTSSVAVGRTFLQLLDTDLGMRPANVVTLSVSVQGTRYRGGPAERQYYRDALERLRAVPGVEAAGAISYLPLLRTGYMGGSFQLDSGQKVFAVTNAATPGYFQAIGTTLIAGRDFDPAGRSEPAVIVNEAFAQAAGLGTAIIGRRLKTQWRREGYVIAGLVATTRFAGPSYPGAPQVFWPIDEEPPAALTFVARVRGDAEALLGVCAQAIRGLDREVPVYDLKTLDQRLADILARPKFYTTATLFLASLAMLLAAVGTYGAAAYSVERRKREMGLRMALGASCSRIRAMVVRESLLPIAAGVAAGIAGAIPAGRYLEHLIFQAQRVDPWLCAAGAGVLLAAGFLAAWSATTRVLSIAPADALRAD